MGGDLGRELSVFVSIIWFMLCHGHILFVHFKEGFFLGGGGFYLVCCLVIYMYILHCIINDIQSFRLEFQLKSFRS